MTEAPGVVYDCMIFLQAALRPDREHGTMRVAREGLVKLFVSPKILAEIQDVLTRPELTAKFSELKPKLVDAFIEDLLSYSTVMANAPAAFALPRDPKDEPYIDLAIAAGANYLVTWNERRLGYLMKQDTAEGRDFCHRFPALKIVDPPTFLQNLRSPPRT